MKKHFYIAGILITIWGGKFSFGQPSTNKEQPTIDRRWETLYSGYTSQQELLDKRARTSKTFRNSDGTNTIFFTGLTHYKDENGTWKDVNYNITQNNSVKSISHKYSNTTSEIKSYFPEFPGNGGITMKNNNLGISFWHNPKMQLTDNGKILFSQNAFQTPAAVSENKLTYPNIYTGMNEEIIVLEDGLGIEDNIIVNQLNPAFAKASAEASLEYYQFIPLSNEWKVYNGTSETTNDFTSENFFIKKESDTVGFVFSPIVVFDAGIANKEEALKLLTTPKDKLKNEESTLLSHIVKGTYRVVFVKGGIEVYSCVPYNWFTEINRVFPITIDPTITIGSAGTAYSACFWDGYYTDTRIQTLFLASEFIGGGMANNDIITAIDLNCVSNGCSGTHTGLTIRMQNTASASFGSLNFTNAGYTNVYSGSKNVNATGWHTHAFGTNYTFNSSQNIIIDFSMNMGTYLCFSTNNTWRTWATGTTRWIGDYFASDNGNPLTWATAAASANILPYIRVTYTPGTPPGNAYGIYSPGATSNIQDCEIYAAGGTGTPASTSCKVCSPTDIGYTNVNISNTTSFPIIVAGDGTNNNTNCTTKNMNMTTGAGSPTWTFPGGTPGSGSGSPLTVQYAATGRQNVVMNGSTYRGFNNIITTAPSSGSILSSYTNGCPGAYYFSSSIGSTTGFSFAWSETHTGGGAITVSFAPANTYSSNVTFTNSGSTVETVTITVTPTSQCCGVLPAVTYTFNVNPLPVAPTITPSSATICPGGTAVLTATSPANCSFDWYTVSSGGTPFASGPSCSVSPAVTTTYYCESTNAYGCISNIRQSVVVTVTPTSPPTVSGVSSCSPDFVTISVSSPIAGATYNFYSGNCTGLLQSSSSSSYTAWVSATTTFYVSVTDVTNGCNASACQPVTVTITGSPASVTWNGTTGGTNNWFINTNWTPNCIPTCNTDVSIPNVGSPPDIGFSTTYGNAESKNIIINSSATLSFSDAKAELDVCGDFIHSGTITTNSLGKIVFKGSVAQSYTMTSTGSGELFNVVLANTASPAKLTIKEGVNFKDMTIASNGTFSFQNGVLVVEGARNLVIKNTSPSSLSGYGASAYVFGRLRRHVVSGSAYDFPVGGNPYISGTVIYPYELMNINFTSITGMTYLTAVFDNPNNVTGNNPSIAPTLPEPTQTSVIYDVLIDHGGPNTGSGYAGTVSGIWTVIPDAGTATYNMTVYGKNYDNAIYAGPYYTIVKRNTHSMCGSIPAWGLNGSPVASTTTGNLVTCTRTGMSGFSQFGIGRSPVPLPVELISFEATCLNAGTKISWATASEMNNDYFTLERSCDENFFQYQTIATIPGAGNSNTVLVYSYTDNDDTEGDCYYRLSQTDYNGSAEVFAPIAINCNDDASFNLIGVLPNPALNEIYVLFNSDKTDEVHIYITDVMGQQLFEKNIRAEIGLNKIEVDFTNFASGVYFVKLNNANKSFIKKVVKK